MRTIPAGRFKALCLRLMDEVRNTREPVLITKKGRPVAKLIAFGGDSKSLIIHPASTTHRQLTATQLSTYYMGSLEFSTFLLQEAKVAVSPGIGFGEYGDKYVRFALIENEHRTRQAIRRRCPPPPGCSSWSPSCTASSSPPPSSWRCRSSTRASRWC